MLIFTKALALEWAPKVRINHNTTGLIRTESAAWTYSDDGGATVASLIPMDRMTAATDIANACLCLASDLSSYVTGAKLAVHGGGKVPARYIVTRR